MRPFELSLLYPHGWLADNEACKSTFASLRAGQWDLGLLEAASTGRPLVEGLLNNTLPKPHDKETTQAIWFHGRRRQLTREMIMRGAQMPSVSTIDAQAEHDPWLHAELAHALVLGHQALVEAFRVGELRAAANDKGHNLSAVRKWMQENKLTWESPFMGTTVLDAFLAMAYVPGIHPGWVTVGRGQSASEKQTKIQRRKDLLYLAHEVLPSHATPARLGMWWAALQPLMPISGPSSDFLQEELVESDLRPALLKLIPLESTVDVLEALVVPSASPWLDALRFPAVASLFENLHRFTRTSGTASAPQHFTASRERMWTVGLKLAALLPSSRTPLRSQAWAGSVATGLALWDVGSSKGWGFDRTVWDTSADAAGLTPEKQQEVLVEWLTQPGPSGNRLGQLDSMVETLKGLELSHPRLTPSLSLIAPTFAHYRALDDVAPLREDQMCAIELLLSWSKDLAPTASKVRF